MAHGDADLTLEKGTTFNTRNAAFLVKNGAVDIDLDDSELNVSDGVLLQLIDNDDSTVGVSGVGAGGPIFNTTFFEKAGWPDAVTQAERDNAPPSEGPGGPPPGEGGGGEGGPGGPPPSGPSSASLNVTNADLTGDIYNASGYKYISNSADAAPSYADPKSLSVTLGTGATLKGAISLSRSMHVWVDWAKVTGDTQGGYYKYRSAKTGALGEGNVYQDTKGKSYVQATNFTIDSYYNLGHVINQPGVYAEGATADVALTNNAAWTITGDSYLTSLNISDNAKIVNETNGEKILVLTVDGIEKVSTKTSLTAKDIKAGGYTGNVVLKLVPAPKQEQKPDAVKFAVTFDSVGGSVVSARIVDAGTAIGTLPTATKKGFKLDGWYLNGKKIDASQKITADTIVTAKWLSSDASLKTLKAATGKFSPKFAKAKTKYTVSLKKKQASTKLTVGPNFKNAKKVEVKIGSGKYKTVKATTKTKVKVKVGKSVKVLVKVTAQDGKTTKTYTITVKRAKK
jgi:hypothetical protein